MSEVDFNNTTVVLLNMGGPDSLEAVEPFLYNLFNDPNIISIPGGKLIRPVLARLISRRRAAKVIGYYKKIGGKSPLNEITLKQAELLKNTFDDHQKPEVKIAMRYCKPLTEETLNTISDDHKIILLPLYPQYSNTTTGSSFQEMRRLSKELNLNSTKIVFVSDFHDNPLFIKAWSSMIQETIQQIPVIKRESVPIVFSAHGVPQRVIKRGDPYQQQIEKSVKLISEELNCKNTIRLSYQSKVGIIKWLEPSTLDTLHQLGRAGNDSVVVVPVSFVSENSETLYELDILFKEESHKAGIKNFYRVPALNDSHLFIEALKDVVIKHVNRN